MLTVEPLTWRTRLRPLNFLHLTTFYPPYSFGGDAVYVHRLFHALADAGHSVDVVHCVDSYHLLHPEPPPVAYASHPGVTVHALRSRAGWLSPLLTHQTGKPGLKARPLRALLESKSFDILHFHNISLLGPGVLTLAPPDGSCLKLFTLHENWLICPTHVLWKFNRRPCEKPQCLACTLLARRPPQLWRYSGFLDRCVANVDALISPSRFLAEIHRKRGFTRLINELPYLIPEPRVTTRPDADVARQPYFLFVGRLEAIKGLQTLIPLWDRVSGADLVVAGTGEYESVLRQQAAPNPRIRFLGVQSQERLAHLYRNALACIVPSVGYESFCMIPIEGFAYRTPAIVRDLGGLPESIRRSGGGFTYQSDEELLAAISRIQSSRQLRRELGEKGYRGFREHWSTPAHLEKYFHLIETLGAARSPGRT